MEENAVWQAVRMERRYSTRFWLWRCLQPLYGIIFVAVFEFSHAKLYKISDNRVNWRG